MEREISYPTQFLQRIGQAVWLEIHAAMLPEERWPFGRNRITRGACLTEGSAEKWLRADNSRLIALGLPVGHCRSERLGGEESECG